MKAKEFVNNKLGDKNYTTSDFPISRAVLEEWLNEFVQYQLKNCSIADGVKPLPNKIVEKLQSILTDLENKEITKHQAYDLILSLFDVVEQGEQLTCQCDEPADNAYPNGTIFCENCGLNTWTD